ncbi:heterokaryon incompatibility protein-domain-containing protein, partial [Pyrenochaeta sp. MPI-SDFR-AT-0127]
MFRTLHENIKDRFQRIDKKRMPRVLQDAIKVTRALALRYLWMDTICMIQDDVEDKKKEMPYMGEYYANAIFTIAASSSADSTVPFIDRRHVYYKPKSFPFQNAYVQARVLGVEGHLAKRGWTWQESTFSSRVLNFTPSELVWECKGMVESECGYDPQLFNSLGLAHKYGDLDDHSDTQAFALWRDCIQAYSDRKLSDFTDCLPAVSGLAKSIKKRTQSNYYAGIWVKDMVPSLLWDVRPSFNREKSPLPKVPSPKDMDTGDPKECTAPSWSWASVEGWVKTSEKTMAGSTKYASYPLRGSGVGDRSFAGLKQDANIEVVGRDSRRLASDDFLGDMRAVLKVEGRLIQVRLICDWDATTGWAYKLGLPNGSKT